MRKTVPSTVVVALLLGVCSSTSALANSSDDAKPVAVVSLASYDELRGNVEMAGKLAGRPALARGLEGMLAVATHGRGLAGLDKKRPWGAVIQLDGSELGGYAFLPVDDLAKFEEVLEPYVRKVEDLGNGVRKVEGMGPRQTVYVKHKKNGWLFVCDKPEGLANTPEEPTALLGQLHKQYDLAIRLNVGNVPAEKREQFIGRIEQWSEENLERRPGEDEQEHAVRKMIGAKAIAAILSIAEDLDTVTVGWSLDDDAQRAFFELAMTAKKGSPTADTLTKLAEVKTDFAGFRLPDATVTGSMTASCPYASSAELDELFEAIRVRAFEDIDAREQSDEKAKAGKEILSGLLEVIRETAASGRADGAMSVVLDPQAATLVAGRYIANGPKLEETLEKAVEAARQEDPDLVDEVLKKDAEQFKGVRLHTLTIPVPDDVDNRDKVVQLVGNAFQVVVGVGEESVYLAAGRDAVKTLKGAIERSAAEAQQRTPPMELSLALGKVANFLAETGQGRQRQRALAAVAALRDATGRDHVRLLATPIERGLKLRLELEQGVLKVIEAMLKKPDGTR